MMFDHSVLNFPVSQFWNCPLFLYIIPFKIWHVISEWACSQIGFNPSNQPDLNRSVGLHWSWVSLGLNCWTHLYFPIMSPWWACRCGKHQWLRLSSHPDGAVCGGLDRAPAPWHGVDVPFGRMTAVADRCCFNERMLRDTRQDKIGGRRVLFWRRGCGSTLDGMAMVVGGCCFNKEMMQRAVFTVLMGVTCRRACSRRRHACAGAAGEACSICAGAAGEARCGVLVLVQ